MKKAQVFISTQQNPVNVFPLLMKEFSGCTPIAVSSKVALNLRWTANLEFVLHRKKLDPVHVHLYEEDEKSGNAPNTLKETLQEFDQVFFNISGGKKNLILLLLEAYNLRSNPHDRIIYVDNRPTTVKVFEGYRNVGSYPVPFLLDLEDVLNLHGYTKLQTPSKPSYLSEMDKPDDQINRRIAKLNSFFLEDNDFAKLLYSYFGKAPSDFDDKSKIRARIEQVIKEHRPSLEQCKVYLDPENKNSYETLFQEIEELKKSSQTQEPEYRDLKDIWKKWKRISNEYEIFSKYWSCIKRKLVGLLSDMIHSDDSTLSVDQQQISKLVGFCNQISGKDSSVPEVLTRRTLTKLLDFDLNHGQIMEDMFAEQAIKNLMDVQNRMYFNIKVYPLGYDENGTATYQDLSSNQNLVEFDAVFVTNSGTLTCFECKTFGFEGDVVKAKDQSSHSHGGVFSKIILVTHLQGRHLNDPEMLPYIPQQVSAQLEAVKKYNVEIWYFDEIAEKISNSIK